MTETRVAGPGATGGAKATRRAPRAFGNYAAMEGINVLLVPGAVLLLTWPDSLAEWSALAAASVATGLFLVVGTLFWRGVHRRLCHGDRSAMRQAVAFADKAERPGLVLTALASATTGWALSVEGLSGAVIGAAALTLLALLEWINYYRRQLQHFDNGADFKRLLSGQGFKRAHMARELEAYRRESGRH
jgi:hypothetical protein